MVVVHVDNLFAMGRKSRCDKGCEDLNQFSPTNNLEELRWYALVHWFETGGQKRYLRAR